MSRERLYVCWPGMMPSSRSGFAKAGSALKRLVRRQLKSSRKRSTCPADMRSAPAGPAPTSVASMRK